MTLNPRLKMGTKIGVTITIPEVVREEKSVVRVRLVPTAKIVQSS